MTGRLRLKNHPHQNCLSSCCFEVWKMVLSLRKRSRMLRVLVEDELLSEDCPVKNAPSILRSLSLAHPTICCLISPLRYTRIIGILPSGKFGMHLSPTIETNFVRGCRAASVCICWKVRSDAGILYDDVNEVNYKVVKTHPSLYRKQTTPVPLPDAIDRERLWSSVSLASRSSSTVGDTKESSSTLLASVISRV